MNLQAPKSAFTIAHVTSNRGCESLEWKPLRTLCLANLEVRAERISAGGAEIPGEKQVKLRDAVDGGHGRGKKHINNDLKHFSECSHIERNKS